MLIRAFVAQTIERQRPGEDDGAVCAATPVGTRVVVVGTSPGAQHPPVAVELQLRALTACGTRWSLDTLDGKRADRGKARPFDELIRV